MTPEEKEEVKSIVVECLKNTFDTYREVHELEEELVRKTVETELLNNGSAVMAVRGIIRLYLQDSLNTIYGDSYFMQQKVVQELQHKLPY